jgi:hypothetical protein
MFLCDTQQKKRKKNVPLTKIAVLKVLTSPKYNDKINKLIKYVLGILIRNNIYNLFFPLIKNSTFDYEFFTH